MNGFGLLSVAGPARRVAVIAAYRRAERHEPLFCHAAIPTAKSCTSKN
jgi:hypothetical protein